MLFKLASEMYKLPEPSNATPSGSITAVVAGMPSAMLPYCTPPAKFVIMPVRIYFSDLVVVIVGQIDISSVVDGQIGNEIDLRAGGRSIVARVSRRSRCLRWW